MNKNLMQTLQDALRKRNLFGWQILEVEKNSRQSFLALGERECVRAVRALHFDVSIYRLREENGKRVLGTSAFKLSPESFPQIEKALDQAVFSADLLSNAVFELPEMAANYPEVEMFDKSLNENSLEECEERTKKAISKERGVRLSSAEFFIDTIKTRIINHCGLDATQQGSVLEWEIILLAENSGKEKEFISRFKRRFLSDFNFEDEIHRSATFAHDANKARLPQTGEFAVVFSGEPLDRLFEPLVAWSSARLKYNRIVDKKLGSNLIGAGKVMGDPVSIWSNGILEGGLGTSRFDGFGTPMNRVLLIQNNILKNFLANKQYADYLNIPVTGDLGNIEVGPGSTPFGLFLDPGLIGEKTIYHIQAFSAFEPNPITGAFSGEIRSGYEISQNGIQPIKGGSVSGILQKALQNCLISKELEMRERILSPEGILFKKLTLAGS